MESGSSSDALSFEYDMRPALRRAWRWLGVATLLVQAAVLLPQLAGEPSTGGGQFVMFVNLLLISAAVVLVLIRRWHSKPMRLVTIGAAGIAVPALWHWRGNRHIAIADLRRLARVVVNGQDTLFLSVLRQQAVVLPLSGFASDDERERFVDALAFRSRIRPQQSALDHGITRYAAVLILGLFALHVVRECLGPVDVASLLHWGALNRTLVFDGEWYRLFTYALLQPDVLQLTLHGIALAILVPALQRMLGSAAVSLILVVGAIGGGIGALSWIDGTIALGVDGALYGLLGALLWTRISAPALISPPLWRLPVWLWMAWLMFDGALGVLGEGVALPLRLLGLFSGCACAGLLELLERRARFVAAWLGVGALALAALSASAAIAHRLLAPSSDAQALELTLSDAASLPDANIGAWLLASAPSANSAALEAARARLSELMSARADVDPTVRDTLATLHYRLGNYVEALTLEAQVQRDAPAAVYATQLARFAIAAGSVALDGNALLDEQADRLCVQVTSDGARDVDVLLYDDERLLGILQFERVGERACSALAVAQPERVRAEIGRIAPSPTAGSVQVRYWRADPGILALP